MVAAVGVSVNHDAVATLAAQELVNGHAREFAFDVPQRHVNGSNRSHGHRSTTPVGTAVKVLPDVLNIARITTNEARKDVILQIRLDRQLTPVEGGITQPPNSFVGDDPDRDKVAPRTGDDGLYTLNFQAKSPQISLVNKVGGGRLLT